MQQLQVLSRNEIFVSLNELFFGDADWNMMDIDDWNSLEGEDLAALVLYLVEFMRRLCSNSSNAAINWPVWRLRCEEDFGLCSNCCECNTIKIPWTESETGASTLDSMRIFGNPKDTGWTWGCFSSPSAGRHPRLRILWPVWPPPPPRHREVWRYTHAACMHTGTVLPARHTGVFASQSRSCIAKQQDAAWT